MGIMFCKFTVTFWQIKDTAFSTAKTIALLGSGNNL